MDIDEIVVLEVAAEARVDRRSVRKEIRKAGSVRGLVGARIRRALAKRMRVEVFEARNAGPAKAAPQTEGGQQNVG
jgi:hypothetical protein